MHSEGDKFLSQKHNNMNNFVYFLLTHQWFMRLHIIDKINMFCPFTTELQAFPHIYYFLVKKQNKKTQHFDE